MTRTIAVANQKGGVGKTTTTINLAACLAEQSCRTLLIDMDPQCNAGSGVGMDRNDSIRPSIYDVLVNDEPLDHILVPGPCDGLTVAPSNRKLAGAEIELVSKPERERVLHKALTSLSTPFDYIIIDCPPSLGILTVNALCGADSVIVPLQCEYYALEGISALLESIDLVRASLNPSLTIAGVLLTMHDSRTNLSDQVAEEVRNFFRDQVFDVIVPRNVRLSEAPSHGVPIIQYDPGCKGAAAYRALAMEIIRRET
ncbi:MAG TPA: AAA family ATPase [bacterium]|nr:AAA family ATPase [bacterium]